MKLDKQVYGEIRDGMRTEMVRLIRTDANAYERINQTRRLSRLDMAWAKGTEWYDFIPGETGDTVFHGTFN